ncbi:MAG TPA: hypothetical protein VF121_16765 [Thermoanaerobaculia bacterium]|nr:hypothetical protein [Thermoanaerobaculia bacterium]
MGLPPRFARRFRFLRLLQLSLLAGALYDAAFALLLVARPQLPARWLDLPLPGERFYLWVLATLLLMLAALYLEAARDPRRYSAVVAVAIGGRLLGSLALLAAALPRPDLAGLLPLSAVDGAFGLCHAVLWWPIRS